MIDAYFQAELKAAPLLGPLILPHVARHEETGIYVAPARLGVFAPETLPAGIADQVYEAGGDLAAALGNFGPEISRGTSPLACRALAQVPLLLVQRFAAGRFKNVDVLLTALEKLNQRGVYDPATARAEFAKLLLAPVHAANSNVNTAALRGAAVGLLGDPLNTFGAGVLEGALKLLDVRAMLGRLRHQNGKRLHAPYTREDEALYQAMVRIRDRLNYDKVVAHPVTPGDTITSGSEDPKAVMLRDKVSEAITALQPLFSPSCTRAEALACWDKVFNTTFFSERHEEEARSSLAAPAIISSLGLLTQAGAAAAAVCPRTTTRLRATSRHYPHYRSRCASWSSTSPPISAQSSWA